LKSSSDSLIAAPRRFYGQTGARAILLVLQQVFPGTDQWRRPLSELTNQSGDKRFTMIVMAPDEPLSETEAAIVDRWIFNGGQLILPQRPNGVIRKPFKSVSARGSNSMKKGFSPHGLMPIPDLQGEMQHQSRHQNVGSGRIVYVRIPTRSRTAPETNRRRRLACRSHLRMGRRCFLR
jgi:hypothetical protein